MDKDLGSAALGLIYGQVRYGDAQWRRYLHFRDRLRADADARAAYVRLKRRLATRFADDRWAYTGAKASFITRLLSESEGTQQRGLGLSDGSGGPRPR